MFPGHAREWDEEARAAIRAAGLLDAASLEGVPVPRESVAAIRDGARGGVDKHTLLTQLLGTWLVDNCAGKWVWCPVPIDRPYLYQKYCRGVETEAAGTGSAWPRASRSRRTLARRCRRCSTGLTVSRGRPSLPTT